ncbi:hypothetical protein ASC64_05185 [Nocardioides sp. Root122]|uniref:hypothetical protein n=1 Tax=Nocardioides TaxID=1839 RepID=UPI000702A8F1|nr:MULTISPECIES: hypothetical protein [Nocardioides]KQV71424.1 hypothetical protein ASC64_05185 [Nocardioides sp. Root122]MCK9822602.1 hypothetical protein [Nocardioides cavernae]
MDVPRWRPQVLWVPMGGLLGAAAGAATGAVLLLVVALVADDVTLARADGSVAALGAVVPIAMLGGFFGAIAGLAVGLVVGLEMTFLVGSHLSREVARHRAYRLGLVLPPLTMAAPVVVTALAEGADRSLSGTNVLWWVVALGGASLFGGPMARWLAGFQPSRPPASQGGVRA